MEDRRFLYKEREREREGRPILIMIFLFPLLTAQKLKMSGVSEAYHTDEKLSTSREMERGA